MAELHDFHISAHPNLYTGEEREMRVLFAVPDKGVNEQTNLLLLISNFGESVDDEQFTSAREQFADRNNSIVVQCDYFGSRFMGMTGQPEFQLNAQELQRVLSEEDWNYVISDQSIQMERLMEVTQRYSLILTGRMPMAESESEFNDMGIMQALDNISAVLAVSAIMKDNGHELPQQIAIYGRGHGAYLSYLCNAFAPYLFTQLIDYEGYLYPNYLLHDRSLHYQKGLSVVSVVYPYYARQYPHDEELLNLSKLYKNRVNNSQIISFSENDQLETAKRKFTASIPYCMFNQVNGDEAQGGKESISLEMSTTYTDLLNYVFDHLQHSSERIQQISLPNVTLHTLKYKYVIKYSLDMPRMERISK